MNTKQANGRKCTHRIMYKGNLASEHMNRANAEKAVRRGISMSRGKLTEADFKIVEL